MAKDTPAHEFALSDMVRPITIDGGGSYLPPGARPSSNRANVEDCIRSASPRSSHRHKEA